jgi:hypothetical protein
VHLNTAEARTGSVIYYSTAASPNQSDLSQWNLYDVNAGVLIGAGQTLSAFTYVSSIEFSTVAAFPYTFACSVPVFTVDSGSYRSDQAISFYPPTPTDGTIHYELTTDGTDPVDPTSASAAWDGSTAITTLSSATYQVKVKAFTARSGWADSAIVSANYVYDQSEADVTVTVVLPSDPGLIIPWSSDSMKESIGPLQSITVGISVSSGTVSSYAWYLNGVGLGVTDSSITVGNVASSTLPYQNLAEGSYKLTCVVTMANGLSYSITRNFAVDL